MFHHFMFHLCMANRLRLPLLILAAAAVYLLGNGRVALWDRDEPRNAQAARQMYQTGDWVVPHFLDQIRTAKPVFTYWCQVGAMYVFGDTAFAARFPSVVAMTLTLIVLGIVLGRKVDRDRAFWTVFILATSAMVIGWNARASLTDSVLLLWIVIAQLCLFAILHGNSTWLVIIVMSIAIGLAALTKGPVVLGVMATTLIALATMNWKKLLHPKPARGFEFIPQSSGTGASPVRLNSDERHERGARATNAAVDIVLKCLVAIVIVAAIVGPWVYLVEHRAPGFIFTTASHDVVKRIFEPLEQHKGPPGYYLIALWGIYFPWSLLLPLTFVIAWRHRDDPVVRFCLAATIGPWLMVELVQTKLPHYLLPAFPPLAFLTADAIVRCLRGEHGDLASVGTRIGAGIWAIIVAALSFTPWLALRSFPDLPRAPMIALTFCGLAYASVVLIAFVRNRLRCGLLAMGIGMLVTIAVTFGIYLPSADFFRLSVNIADVLRRNGGDAVGSPVPGSVMMISYKEPTLAFYQGGTIREQPKNDYLLLHPASEWPRFLVIRDDVWTRMPAAIKDQLDILGQCRGWDYVDRGRIATVTIVRKKPTTSP